MPKYAIRIVTMTATGRKEKLFAVVPEKAVMKYRNMVYELLCNNEMLSSSWSSVRPWGI